MKKSLFLLIVAGIVVIAIAVITYFTIHTNNKPHNIQIYGHRGARALSPENSLPAYKTGLAIGIDFVDMDVNMTKDRVIVVTHDIPLNPNLTRDKNGNWVDPKNPPLVKDLTLAELQQYDIGKLKPDTDYAKYFPLQNPVDGTHISSLQQVIDYVTNIAGKNIKFQVEIKNDPEHPDWSFTPAELAKATVDVLRSAGIDTRTELQAFDWRALQEVQKLDPNIATAYLTDQEQSQQMRDPDPKKAGLWTAGYLLKDYRYSIPRMIAKLGGKIWGAESKELTADLVKEAHSYGLKVVPWSQVNSLDDPQEIIRLINIGVDGIISDRPDVVRGLLAARGLRVPPSYPVAKEIKQENL